MKPILTLPPPATREEVKSAQAAGYIVIKTSRPDRVTVKVPIPNLELSGNDIISAAAEALCAGDMPGDDQRRPIFVRAMFDRMRRRSATSKPGGDQ